MKETIERWASLLRDTSATVVGPMLAAALSVPDLSAAFRDESGHRREIDPLLIAAALGGAQPTPACVGGTPPEASEAALWRMLFSPAGSPERFLSDQNPGPLLRHADRTAIEVLTEADLCGLHALWSIARRNDRTDLAKRCLAAAAWHVAELQPDNATQSPWAIHVFVVLGAMNDDATALIDAETRLHNCMVGRGRPDKRSALILHHAAGELDAILASLILGRSWFHTV